MPSSAASSVCMVGAGYVGLPMALILARSGRKVTAVDINETIVHAIKSGRLHIQEGSLQEVYDEPVVRENLTAQTTPCAADVFMIAVPTPLARNSTEADLTAVRKATESLVPFVKAGNLVILESTVPPRTCRDVLTPILEKSGLKVGVNLHLAHCPERILPGATLMQELVHNDRIIGAADETTRNMVADLYKTVVDGKLLMTDDITAELTKLMENTYRDVNIALANQLHTIATNLGACPSTAREFANHHPRVNILSPGIGVGGHCIPIDPWFIVHADPKNSDLIRTARLVNDAMPSRTAKRIQEAIRVASVGADASTEFSANKHRVVAVGATYKPDVADTRESPASQVVEELRLLGFNVTHIDPHVQAMTYSGTLAKQCEGAAALVVLVGHTNVLSEVKTTRAAIVDALTTDVVMTF